MRLERGPESPGPVVPFSSLSPFSSFSSNFIFFIKIQLIYHAVPTSAVQQSDSVIHT